jgi:hypothetical protein
LRLVPDDQILNLGQEPGVDLADALNVSKSCRHESIRDKPSRSAPGLPISALISSSSSGFFIQAVDTGFQDRAMPSAMTPAWSGRSPSLRHRFHLRRQTVIGLREISQRQNGESW